MSSDGEALQKIPSVRADVVALLREKRYEETLAALYRARAESPDDRELQKSIDQLKTFLIGTYAKRLGGLDQIAKPIPLSAVRTPDSVLLARYIDGTSTYGDLAQICPLGQLRTLQVLVGLYQGAEPTRIYGMDSRAPEDAPRSGLRVPEEPGPHVVPASGDFPESERAPDTARSAAVAATARAVESEEARQYRELFGRGTAAFVQGRYRDAAEAFQACLQLRPDDRGAAVMLRRAEGNGESR
jgi:tetratricopeptide (TPR) repeat protein